VSSLLNDRAAVDYYDTISPLNGTQPVRNDDDSSTFQVGIDCLLNLTFDQIKIIHLQSAPQKYS